jgi:hypothetical protein
MQLSLIAQFPELQKRVFLDVFAKMYYDTRRSRPRLKTIGGQLIPADMQIGCNTKVLKYFPEGTIYKLDVRLIQRHGHNSYFIALKQTHLQRALEFYDYNINLQKGIIEVPKKKIVTKIIKTQKRK